MGRVKRIELGGRNSGVSVKRDLLSLGLFSGSILAAILPSTAANAQTWLNTDWRTDNYLQGNLGAAFDSNTHIRGVATPTVKGDAAGRPGFFASGLIGHNLGQGFALEGEVVYADNDIHRAGSNSLFPAGGNRSVDTYGALVNLKYELPTRWQVAGYGVSPYVAGGVGYGGVSYDVAGADQQDDGLLWQAKTGVAVHLSPRMTLDVGYRYLNGPQFEPAQDGTTLGGLNLSTHQHIASIGARWTF